MSKLIQIPSGDWLDPQSITAVRFCEESECSFTGRQRARVVVDFGGNSVICLANDNDHAKAMQAELAGRINGARE